MQTNIPTDPGIGGGFNASSSSSFGTSGTLGSRGLYRGVAPPRQSQARGIQGTDERAYTRNVTGDELVQNQINDLTNRGNAHMQNAGRRAQERAFGMGLGRSSIAAGAGERAALEAAMPIAQADAATFGRTQSENMGALNQALMQERDILNAQTLEGLRQSTAGADMAMRERLAREEMALGLQRQRENLAFQGEMQGLDRSQQQWMAQFGLGADLTRGQQGFGFQLRLNEQGFNQDMARMGQQFRYEDMAAQRDFRNSLIGTEFGSRINLNSQWRLNAMQNYWDDPSSFNPADLEAIMNVGTRLYGSTSDFINNLFGRGG